MNQSMEVCVWGRRMILYL